MAPRVFFRVQHDSSRVTYSHSRGFSAESYLHGNSRNLRRTLDDSLVENFEDHCNKIHTPTALISVCSSPQHTLDYAEELRDVYHREGIRIYEIHADRNTHYFHAQQFARDIKRAQGRQVIEYDNWEYLEDEYLVINNIPQNAVVGVWSDLDEFADDFDLE